MSKILERNQPQTNCFQRPNIAKAVNNIGSDLDKRVTVGNVCRRYETDEWNELSVESERPA